MAEVLRPGAVGTSAGVGAPRSSEGLDRHAIGLPAVTAQSAALIGPAAGSVAVMAFIASLAGGASPLAFLIGFIGCLLVALVIFEYAKRLPSAGAFYTYLTHTFGAKTGFVTGVLLFGAYLLLFPFQLNFFGNFVSSLFPGEHIPYQIFAAALIIFSTVLGILGIRPTLRTGLIGLCFEVAVLTSFALIIIVQGGAHGNTIQVFNPSSSLNGASGIFTAVVYTIFAFVGFESATALGDEARKPRRTIPWAVVLTTVSIGIFYVVVNYAVTIGYGNTPAGIKALVAAPAPFTTLADRFGNGTLAVFIDLAVISSFTALDIVTVNAISRIFWKMGKDGLLPHGLAKVNRFKAPGVAVLLTGGLAIVTALVGGGIWGPLTFATWLAYFATLFFIGAYLVIAVGLTVFIWRKHRSEFNWFRHALIPLGSVVAMAWVLKGNITPYPAAPLRWFIYATIGAILVAFGVAVWLERRNPDTMRLAGAVLGEADDEEAALSADQSAPSLTASAPIGIPVPDSE